MLQRRLGLPDASVLVLQGMAFVLILASEATQGTDWRKFFARLFGIEPLAPRQEARA
jgi:simple sugar transport system permease protein